MENNKTASTVKLLESEALIHHSLVVWPWRIPIIFLNVSFYIYKMG